MAVDRISRVLTFDLIRSRHLIKLSKGGDLDNIIDHIAVVKTTELMFRRWSRLGFIFLEILGECKITVRTMCPKILKPMITVTDKNQYNEY